MKHITKNVLKCALLALPLYTMTSHALVPESVTASSDDGNIASNTLDTNLATRWSALGDGQWIAYELGAENHQIDSLSLAFFKGDQRTANFQVQVSNDTQTWTTVWSGDQPSSTLELQTIALDTQGRYLRILGFGNSQNGWNSITEVEIDATPVSAPTPESPIAPASVSASADDGNSPQNTLDNDLATRWSANGDGQWIAYDLGPVRQQITGIDIAFFRGDQRTANFEIQVSDNASDWDTPNPAPISGDLNSVPSINCSFTVSSSSELEDNTGFSMTAGTTVCLADGTYQDIELSIGGAGTEESPITVAAENPGSVFFEGEAQVRMSGSYVVFQGITFRNGNSSSSDLFQTRGSGDLPCNNCRITEITITDWDQEFEDSNRWFLVFGMNNRIDHSWFSGKSNRGSLLTVDRGIDDPDFAIIDHNYFGDRVPPDGKEFPDTSDNEYEAIRVGTSGTHQAGSFTRIENNYFERIQGEAEIISNKSSFNIIRSNTIRDSYGSIVSRHGSDAEISHNYMFADGYPFAGGIRITDANHRVFNNHIEGCSFANSNFNGGIVLTDSDGNSDSGYQQVDNVLIAHNTIANCVNSINLAGGKSNASRHPTNVTMVNNIITGGVGPLFVNADEGIPVGSFFAGNYVNAESFSDGSLTNLDGFNNINPNVVADSQGLFRLQPGSPALAGGTDNFGDFDAIDIDMDGQQRRIGNPDAGADESSSEQATLRPLTSSDVGPLNYRP